MGLAGHCGVILFDDLVGAGATKWHYMDVRPATAGVPGPDQLGTFGGD